MAKTLTAEQRIEIVGEEKDLSQSFDEAWEWVKDPNGYKARRDAWNEFVKKTKGEFGSVVTDLEERQMIAFYRQKTGNTKEIVLESGVVLKGKKAEAHRYSQVTGRHSDPVTQFTAGAADKIQKVLNITLPTRGKIGRGAEGNLDL